jgi:hypothetical protein
MASPANYASSALGDVLPGFSDEGAPGGVAGPATAGQKVVYDPGTGLYLNTQTGAVSTDPGGQQIVSDPSLATQAARNFATSQQFISQLGQYGAQYNQAQAGQGQLAGELQATIAGTAPSVARSQLEQGLSQIVQQQDSAASGATGTDAALARQNAERNIGTAQATTNQQQALLRAQEVASAEQQLGNVYGAQANEATGMYNTGVGAGENFASEAGGEQSNQASLRQSGGKNQLTTIGTIAGALGGSGTATGGGGSGGTSSALTTAGTTSDVTEKDDVKPADMGDFLSKIATATKGEGGISYTYKRPGADGQSPGKKVGVPAHAVAKSKVGKHIVRTGSDGKLEMDHGEMLGAIIGALAHLHEKVKDVAHG